MKTKHWKTFLVIGLVVTAWIYGYHCGKVKTLQAIQDHPFSCVPGQIVDLPCGRYLCVPQVSWKEVK